MTTEYTPTENPYLEQLKKPGLSHRSMWRLTKASRHWAEGHDARDHLFEEMVEALEASRRLFNEALGKFNWGASALDANAIQLLNDAPIKVYAILDKLAKVKEASNES